MKIRVLRDWKSYTQWQPWFAWYPVLTKQGVLVWLEIVYRRWDGYNYYPRFEYKTKPQ